MNEAIARIDPYVREQREAQVDTEFWNALIAASSRTEPSGWQRFQSFIQKTWVKRTLGAVATAFLGALATYVVDSILK